MQRGFEVSTIVGIVIHGTNYLSLTGPGYETNALLVIAGDVHWCRLRHVSNTWQHWQVKDGDVDSRRVGDGEWCFAGYQWRRAEINTHVSHAKKGEVPWVPTAGEVRFR